jgi:hypothetical protein
MATHPTSGSDMTTAQLCLSNTCLFGISHYMLHEESVNHERIMARHVALLLCAFTVVLLSRQAILEWITS